MNRYIDDIKKIIAKKYYIPFVLLVIVIGYGFDMTNISVNIDNLASDIYHGSGEVMLAAGRFGMSFWSRLCNVGINLIEGSFASSVISLVMLTWAATNFCVLFKRASNDKLPVSSYMIFTASLVSYPLFNEIWSYYGARVSICGGFLFVSFSLLLIEEQISNKKFNLLSAAAITFFMGITASAYESPLCVYVFIVFGMLLIKEYINPDWKKHIKEGLIYVLGVVSGIAFRLIVSKLILIIFNLEKGTNGQTEIAWFSGKPFVSIFLRMIKSVLSTRFGASMFYMPLAVYTVCFAIIGVFLISCLFRKRFFLALLSLGMLISTEIITIIQGQQTPYRTCQVFAVLVAFVLMLISHKIKYKKVIIVVLCLLCVRQSICLNYYFSLNHLKYEEEKTVVNEIGKELSENCDLSKKVAFVGAFKLSDYIMNQKHLSKDTLRFKVMQKVCSKIGLDNYLEKLYFPRTNANSVVNWSAFAFENQIMMEKLFAFYGYDIKCGIDRMTLDEYYEYYTENYDLKPYPQDGYIIETDDVIIVNLGSIKDAEIAAED